MKADAPARSRDDPAGAVTLVLGGGWKLGCAFHAGVLLALHDAWGIDARRVDSVIGTSSGAVIAGLLGAGMSPHDLFRRETAEPLSPEGQELMSRLRDRDEAGAGKRAARDRNKPHRTIGLSPRGVLAALLPRGGRSLEPLERYFDDLVGPNWPQDVDLRFCAVDLGTGQRVVLDRDSAATVGQAVAASCSIPGVSQPVQIMDREYIDGAIYSVNNADLVETNESARRRRVIVSAPLSACRPQIGFGPMAVLRNAIRLQTGTEVRRLGDMHDVMVLEPSADDLAAMGSNLNANRRRARVARRAYDSAFGAFIGSRAALRSALVSPEETW